VDTGQASAPDATISDIATQTDISVAPPDSSPADAGLPDSADNGDSSESAQAPALVELGSGKPSMWNFSAASDDRAKFLALVALDGLGFSPGAASGPHNKDRVFVGAYYIAWIDLTGFVGKMNGLWRMNGAPDDTLDFVVRDGDRPINLLIVGENGDGKFAPGYPGSEHAEFPNNTPEANDNQACGSTDWCNQYAHDEAASFTNPSIPWWSTCNEGQASWSTHHEPIEVSIIEGGLRLVWEAPLVKEADGDGTWDGDACHEDWLFPDGERRPVFLQAGYELFANKQHLDRIMSFRNPAGNPEFTGPMSLIGGFVFTSLPEPHPLKRFHAWVKPSSENIYDPTHDFTMELDTWNDHQHPLSSGDEVFGWAKTPITLSSFPKEIAGHSIHLSNVGPSDNDDTGFCLCRVHGGLEMGGGLLHGDISLPIAPGQTSIEARRRLTLPGTIYQPQTFVYEAETDLGHGPGTMETDGWAANTANHEADFIVFGPYATDWYGHIGTAVFRMMIDIVDDADYEIAVVEVYDYTTGTVLASRSITRNEFTAPMTYQGFPLAFNLTGSIGHMMEVRVMWKDISYLKVDSITVSMELEN